MSTISLSSIGGPRILRMGGAGQFNPDSLSHFNAALDEVLADESAQVLVLTGEDKNFSQGLDLEFIVANPDSAMPFIGECMIVVARLLSFPLPVVAAVNGHAFGLGAMLTLASDYKVMREDRGYFCLPEVDLGTTLTHRMSALVCGKLSGSTLRDVLLTGERVAGPRAQQLGIVDQTAPLEELLPTAMELAAPMCGKSRSALGGLKRGVNQSILSVLESDAPEQPMPGV